MNGWRNDEVVAAEPVVKLAVPPELIKIFVEPVGPVTVDEAPVGPVGPVFPVGPTGPVLPMSPLKETNKITSSLSVKLVPDFETSSTSY